MLKIEIKKIIYVMKIFNIKCIELKKPTHNFKTQELYECVSDTWTICIIDLHDDIYLFK